MISAQEAINRLKEGNERFVSGSPLLESLANPERRSELAAGQEPFAIILGCSDSPPGLAAGSAACAASHACRLSSASPAPHSAPARPSA